MLCIALLFNLSAQMNKRGFSMKKSFWGFKLLIASTILCTGCSISKRPESVRTDEVGALIDNNSETSDDGTSDLLATDTSKSMNDETLKLYTKVLNDEEKILFSDGEEVFASNWLGCEDNSYNYVFMDVNGDEVDELILKYLGKMLIVTDNKGTANEVYIGCTYDMPISKGNVHGVFYCRPGGAPTHYNYVLSLMDKDFNVKSPQYGSWYDGNENGEMDDEDMFFIDQEEKEVSKQDFVDKSKNLLDLQNYSPEWKINCSKFFSELEGKYNYTDCKLDNKNGVLEIKKSDEIYGGYEINDYIDGDTSNYRFLAMASYCTGVDQDKAFVKYPKEVYSDDTALYSYYIVEKKKDGINVYYSEISFGEAGLIYSAK